MYQSQWAPTSANSSSRRKNSANKRHHGGPSKKDSRATPTAWTDPALKEIDEVANSMEVDIQVTNIFKNLVNDSVISEVTLVDFTNHNKLCEYSIRHEYPS